jgi:hypothetical protein
VRRLFTSILILILAPATRAFAQTDSALMGKAGYWKAVTQRLPSGDPNDGPDLQPFVSNLNAVLAVLRRAPVLAQPRGFVASPVVQRELGAPHRPLTGSVRVGVLFFRKDDGGSVVPQDAGPDVAVSINDASCVWNGHDVAFVDSTGSIYYDAPQDSSPVRGIPGFSTDSSCLVIARRGVPVFAPVSRERFLRDARDTLLARLRAVDARSASADVRRAMQPALDTVRALAKHYDAELTAMSPADRRAPAWVKSSEGSPLDLAPPGTEDARQLVTSNPALFNAALPRSAIQLMTIDAVATGGDDGATALFARVRDALDYAGLAALLK